MTRQPISPWRPIALFAFALLLILVAGAIHARIQFLSRGIPDELPGPIAHGGAGIGLNVYLEGLDEEALQETFATIAATGVRIVKQPFYYAEDEPFDWQASDLIFEAAARYEIQVAALLDGDPQRDFAPPADGEAFAAWASEFAERYGEQVRYYFIWDEPNLRSHWGGQAVNAADYGALLAAAAGAIRPADDDAVIVAAPLAPTTERGPENLSDVLFLEELYGAGAAQFFDAAAGKPYGFSSGPEDRRVDHGTLNFSRAILLREVMVRHGDGDKALFAGNWGWNALPANWDGVASIWGQVDTQTRVRYTETGLQRARREWPWMGLMFLEAWRAPEPADDPRHGFDVTGSALAEALPALADEPAVAWPGFHRTDPSGVGQSYEGGWRFSEAFGADISETGDTLTFQFWGADAGLRVRRADYRARLYVTVDGRPAPALPHDGVGAALVLTAPDSAEDYLEIVPVARGLEPGPHVLTVEAYRGWGQWALHGFSVGYRPDYTAARTAVAILVGSGVVLALAGAWEARRVRWASVLGRWQAPISALGERGRMLLTLATALLVTLTGWLTWGEQAAGIYRRLGDGGQLALTAAAASIFYVAPAFLVYLPALLLLFFLIFARPAWGLALVALFFPFYVLPKPMGGYRFSPVEIFILVTAGATFLHGLARLRHRLTGAKGAGMGAVEAAGTMFAGLKARWRRVDAAVLFFLLVATASLFFTERLDVAQNEWRVVIVEPALYYFLLRLILPSEKEMWTILDAFVLGGVVVAVYGLWQYVAGENVITVAGGLLRLHSIYGSPNNVALYLGRILPFLLALALMGAVTPRRRVLYALALAPVGISVLLTFSKGGLFLGVPAGLGLVFLLWLRSSGRSLWPWLAATLLLAIGVIVAIAAVPGLATRLDLQGATTVFRLSLWQASVNMYIDHPLFGVGLDNFLYAYRGRYILESAWQEPDLNHPHNILLDFGTRLGVAGVLAGAWMIGSLIRGLWRLRGRLNSEWRPVAVAIAGSTAQMLAHGLVDHSFFLVDLAFTFFLLLSTVVWLQDSSSVTNRAATG